MNDKALILVVDDMEANRMVLSDRMIALGHATIEAENGVTALDMAKKKKPDLILLDIMMPEMNGDEVLEHLKSDESVRHIPVIMISALSDMDTILRCIEGGADDYLAKPFKPAILKARITAGLEKMRSFKKEEQYRQKIQEYFMRIKAQTSKLTLANAELARAAGLKDEFLANMSHELRTPLTAILGGAEALQEEIYGKLNAGQMKFASLIERGGNHLLSLINDILDIAKIEAGKLELHKEITPVDKICQGSIRLIKQIAAKKRISISCEVQAGVDDILADKIRIKQVLINLLTNAVKFTPEKGRIGLEVQGDRRRDIVRFIVWDSGIGISEEDLAGLFQPFVQVDSSYTREQQGTGLGLVMVARLTEMHGGSVNVKSEVGEGSRFIISLPWQEAVSEESDAADLNAQLAVEPKTSASKLHCSILLAEDNEANRGIITDYLISKGHQVFIAENGAQAIESARENPPDIILMDIQMPVMNGFEAIKFIRADYDLAKVPIIALTALAMTSDREKCIKAGADEYLSKPVQLKELLNTIEAQLQKDEQW